MYALHLILGAQSEQLLRWIPLRHHMHLLSLVWLQLPYFRGATVIYNRAGGPLEQVLTGDVAPSAGVVEAEFAPVDGASNDGKEKGE